MNEEIITFSENELLGILTFPESGKTNISFSVLFLNAGLIHRTGFNRFNTNTARILAEKGICSMRFDIHSIGDSSALSGSQSIDTQALVDIKQAITTLLEKTNTRSCILIGLCSGADFSHIIAHEDQRVSGVVFIDGYAYPTFKFYLKDYFPGIINPLKIIRYVFKKVCSITHKESDSGATYQDVEIYIRSFPPKQKIMNELQSILNREIRLLYVYSGGIPVYYNHASQFFDMFKSLNFQNKVQSVYFKEADHIFTSIDARNKLTSTIIEWIVKGC
jgi:hypothetical protein